jgi:hypothetical protein
MPINTNLNQAPYFDDFDQENQYYRVLFKPGFAVQARELTQLQTQLQDQIEQFGDNIFKEGSIVKGCNFTELDDLQYVRLNNVTMNSGVVFDPLNYISGRVKETIGGQEVELDYVYELVGSTSGLTANIIQAQRGFEGSTDFNAFFINYTNTSPTNKQFQIGEALTINLYKFKVGTTAPIADIPNVASSRDSVSGIRVSSSSAPDASSNVGLAFGIQSAPGIIFQKGNFIFADSQTIVVSPNNNTPTGVSVGYEVTEQLISALADGSLYDNANGSRNENAPGADRLKLTPSLVVKTTADAKIDSNFFTLIRYQNGNAVTIRDVSQYNVLGEEMARRTYEESGNYILRDFPLQTDDRVPEGTANSEVHVLVGQGVAYVKGYRVENSGERAFAIDQISSTEVVNAQSVSLDYGNYLDVTAATGVINIDWTPVQLEDNTGSNIGSAIAINATPTRIYLTGIVTTGGQSVNNVARVSDGAGYFEVDGSRLREVAKKALIFDSGMNSLFDTSDTLIPVRIQEAATQTGNVITLTANPGEDFNCTNDDVLVVDSTNTKIGIIGTPTTSLNNSVLTINLDPADSSATNVTVYYNKRLIGALNGVDPYNKTSHETYVKVAYSPSQTKYNLGFPDVYKIVSVVDASGNDFTSSFRLRPNQKDTYYDLSYMESIVGRPEPSGTLTVRLKVFEVENSTGSYFFTINSYPNTVDRYDIPVHVSESGVRYNLRECFDFRPHVDKDPSANFGATVGSAPTISGTVGFTAPTFTNYGAPLIPAFGNAITTDLEYYLSRIDTIVCDSYGELSLVKGEEEKFAVPPRVGTDQLAIAQISVPGYPAVSQKVANTQRKREYAIKAKSTGIKAFTMKDMHDLDKKIDNLAYYISLNQLEADTQNLVITDENGLSRFKNGFIVDPFNDLTLADIDNSDFNAAIPFNQRILTPSVKTYPIDLKYKTATGSSIFPSTANAKVGTVARNQNVDIIEQPYASNIRNCVSNFYKYVGDGVISPPYDATYDTTTNPVSIDIDLASPFEDFVDQIQQFLPLTDTTSTTSFDPDPGRGGQRGAGTETTTITTRTSEINVEPGSTTTSFVGDFLTNFQFEPFMAGRDIAIYMSGLRPSTRHYFFFDGVNVDAHVLPGTPADNVDNVARYGSKGAAVETDANGVLRAVFALPEETFFVGDRVLEIADVNLYNSIESGSTSKGFVTYRAYNFSVERTSLTTATRTPNIDVNTTTTTRNVARRRRGRDPLAQTFFIKKGMGQGSNSVYLSEVDVFFKRVSDVNGISLQIREVVNGYPDISILPFSVVHKLPSDLTSATSDDGSVATTFTFDAPVRLDVEKEYAIVLQPDASDPNYLVFTSKVGGVDLTPGDTQGSAIVQDWGDGVLFTSTNNSAWKSYQDEDLKFTVRRHNFNSPTGVVTLTNNDHEFLSINDFNGRFRLGERIYQVKTPTSPTSNTVSVSTGSTIVSGTDLTATYVAGDFVKIDNGTEYDIYEVASVDSGVQLTLKQPWAFTNAGNNMVPVVTGVLSYYDKNNPYEIQLEGSSAYTGRVFSPGGEIVGLDSEITANTVSVDNINLSYVQPMIMKASDSSSKLSLAGEFVSPNNVNTTYDLPMKFNDNNHFSRDGVVIYSKSNDPARAKAFDIKVNMENGGNATSTPFVDIEASKLLAYRYNLTNTSATTSKYISKTIELAADLDAEDLELILTAYKPTGTDIKVYVKAKHAYDNAEFNVLDWTELELFEGVGVYSTTTNIRDYREFKYRIPASNKVGSLASGAFTYSNTNGIFEGFRTFAIKIELLSPNVHNAPTLRDYRGVALT